MRPAPRIFKEAAMNKQHTASLSAIRILAFLLGGVLIIGAGIFVFERATKGANGVRNDPIQPRVSYINDVREQLSAADVPERARLESSLAVLAFAQKPEEGLSMLRAIAANPGYTGKDRAIAMRLMADMFLDLTYATPAVARGYLFVGEPYASMMPSGPDEADNLRRGLVALYSRAQSLYELPISHFRIAEVNAQKALHASGPAREEALALAIKHWEEGVRQAQTIRAPLSRYDLQRLVAPGQSLRLRGSVAYALFAITGEQKYLDDARMALDTARTTLVKAGKANETLPMELFVANLFWADLYYLQFLMAEDQGGLERIAGINLMKEIDELYRAGSAGIQSRVKILEYPFAPSSAEARQYAALLKNENQEKNEENAFLQNWGIR